jgi:hypothetical protein
MPAEKQVFHPAFFALPTTDMIRNDQKSTRPDLRRTYSFLVMAKSFHLLRPSSLALTDQE